MNEKELRALFADAVAKGGMTQADVDKIVTDKIAKGECKADDKDGDKDDDADAKMDAEKLGAMAKAVAAEILKADNKGWDDPGHPDSGATSPEFRPPAERTPVSHTMPFDGMAESIMQDLVKAALQKALTPEVIGEAIQKAAEDTLYPLLKGFEADLADGIKKAMSPALKPILDRAQALVNAAKANESLLKAVAAQQTTIGEVVQKAATRKQVKDALEKAGHQPSAAPAPGFQRPTLASLAVVPAPGDPKPSKGDWDVDTISARILNEMNGMNKAGTERDSYWRQRMQQLEAAAIRVYDTEDLGTLAATLGYSATNAA